MTEATTTDAADKTAQTADTTKTTTETATAGATAASTASDAAQTGADKTAADGAAKEFVADPAKSDDENATALAAFEKANKPDDAAGKPGLPDDWREIAAGKDEASLKMLKRYGSLSAVAKALVEKEALIRSGKVKTAKPDETDEKAMAEWRKSEGIPEDAAGYKLPEAVQKRMVDEDKPILSSFTEFAHKKGARPDVVEIATEWYMDMADAAQAKRIETDKADAEETEDMLRKDWAGGEYKANLTMASRWIESVPGLGKDWSGVRGPDGRLLGSNPEFVAWAAENGRSRFGDAVFATGDAERKHTARKDEIEQLMKTDINKYREMGWDKEYEKILDAETRRRK